MYLSTGLSIALSDEDPGLICWGVRLHVRNGRASEHYRRSHISGTHATQGGTLVRGIHCRNDERFQGFRDTEPVGSFNELYLLYNTFMKGRGTCELAFKCSFESMEYWYHRKGSSK